MSNKDSNVGFSPGWWFQPFWKICNSAVSWDYEIPNWMENKYMFPTTNKSLTSSMFGFILDILHSSSQGVVSHDKQQLGILWVPQWAHDLFKNIIPIIFGNTEVLRTWSHHWDSYAIQTTSETSDKVAHFSRTIDRIDKVAYQLEKFDV